MFATKAASEFVGCLDRVCAAAIAMVAPINAKHNNIDFIADVSGKLLRLSLSGNRRNSDSHSSEKWPSEENFREAEREAQELPKRRRDQNCATFARCGHRGE